MAVLTIALVLCGFQVMINNIQTLPSDFFSGKSVGTVAGIGGCSAVAGVLVFSTWLVPALSRVSYVPVFLLGATLVPLALARFASSPAKSGASISPPDEFLTRLPCSPVRFSLSTLPMNLPCPACAVPLPHRVAPAVCEPHASCIGRLRLAWRGLPAERRPRQTTRTRTYIMTARSSYVKCLGEDTFPAAAFSGLPLMNIPVSRRHAAEHGRGRLGTTILFLTLTGVPAGIFGQETPAAAPAAAASEEVVGNFAV